MTKVIAQPDDLDLFTTAGGGAVRLARWLPVVFLILIVGGSVMLRLPRMLRPGVVVSRLDAVFLATSAATGTGLSVVDPVRVLSRAGWAAVTVLSEAGLLGVLVLGAWIVEAINDRFPAARPGGLRPIVPVRSIVFRVTLLTVGLQMVGTLLLFPLWKAEPFPGADAIAAMGQTGFSPLPGGLGAYRFSMLAHGVILPLMVLGGLGYPVLAAVWRAVRERDASYLPPFVRLTLIGTAAAYLLGVLGLTASALAPYFYEALQLGTGANMPVPGPLTWGRVAAAVADSSFLATSARGAGMTTVPMDTIGPAGRFVLMLLMLAGGSPGGAGGGLFVTTLVVGWVGRNEGAKPQALGGALRWAAALVVYFVLLVAGGIFLMSLFEPYPFITIAFEAASAAGGVGLSLGVTGILTSFSKGVLIGMMFLGRCGPLWILANGVRERRTPLRGSR